MQQRINSTNGSTLLRTYFSVFNNNETDLSAYTHPDSNIVNYNTMMDGLRLQDFTLTSADSTPWLYNESCFRNSAMQSIQQFKQNF